MPRLSRDSPAILKEMDLGARQAKLEVPSRETAVFRWGDRTQFYRGTSPMSPDSLRIGEEVAIRYRVSVFGGKFLERLVAKGKPFSFGQARTSFCSPDT